MGANAANANTISIVNSDISDATGSDILIGADDVSNLFSMNINVLFTDEELDPITGFSTGVGITAGLSRTEITWNPNVLSLEGFTSPLSQSPSTTTILPTDQGFFNLQILDIDFTQTPFPGPNGNMTGEFTWATLNFQYIGPGSAAINLNPIVAAGSGDGWLVTGSPTDIIFDTINNATVSAVPVPPAFLLFASAIAGLSISGRRKA